MPKVEQPGRYHGYVTDITVEKSKNGCVQAVAACELHSVFDRDLRGQKALPEVAHIVAYLILTKRDGAVNDSQRKNLMRALGWSGKTLKELCDGDYSKAEVEVIVEDNEGKLRVSWVQSIGGLRPVNETDLAELESLWAAANGGVGTADDPAADPEIPF